MQDQDDRAEVVRRVPIKFGGTVIFSEYLPTMVGYRIVEDEYDEKGERELPYAEIFFSSLQYAIELDSEDFEEFKRWIDRASEPRRIETAKLITGTP